MSSPPQSTLGSANPTKSGDDEDTFFIILPSATDDGTNFVFPNDVGYASDEPPPLSEEYLSEPAPVIVRNTKMVMMEFPGHNIDDFLDWDQFGIVCLTEAEEVLFSWNEKDCDGSATSIDDDWNMIVDSDNDDDGVFDDDSMFDDEEILACSMMRVHDLPATTTRSHTTTSTSSTTTTAWPHARTS